MKFQFDARQQYQLDAIGAVVGLFRGQPPAGGTFELQPDAFGGQLLDRLGVANSLDIFGYAAFGQSARCASRERARNGREADGKAGGRRDSWHA